MILSVAMLLDWAAKQYRRPELHQAAVAMESAVDAALLDGKVRTPDLDGKGTTRGFTKAVVEQLQK